MGHVGFGTGPGVDNHQVDAIISGCVQNAAQLGWLGFHQCGRHRLSRPPPGGGATLRIKIDQ